MWNNIYSIQFYMLQCLTILCKHLHTETIWLQQETFQPLFLTYPLSGTQLTYSILWWDYLSGVQPDVGCLVSLRSDNLIMMYFKASQGYKNVCIIQCRGGRIFAIKHWIIFHHATERCFVHHASYTHDSVSCISVEQTHFITICLVVLQEATVN